jgi:phage-related protein
VARTLPGKVIDAVKSLPGRIRNVLASIPGRMYQLGRDIIAGLINGIKSLIGGVISTLKSGISSAVAGVKRGLGIASDSKVFIGIGEDTVGGYITGVQRSADAARAATVAALMPTAARSAAGGVPARAPVPLNLTSSDPLLSLVLGMLRDEIRQRFGGDVQLALASA